MTKRGSRAKASNNFPAPASDAEASRRGLNAATAESRCTAERTVADSVAAAADVAAVETAAAAAAEWAASVGGTVRNQSQTPTEACHRVSGESPASLPLCASVTSAVKADSLPAMAIPYSSPVATTSCWTGRSEEVNGCCTAATTCSRPYRRSTDAAAGTGRAAAARENLAVRNLRSCLLSNGSVEGCKAKIM